MDANVWKTTRIGANHSVPFSVGLRFGLSSNFKYVSITANLPRENVSQKIRMREDYLAKKMKLVVIQEGEQSSDKQV